MTLSEALAARDAALDRAQSACTEMLAAMHDAIAAAASVRAAVPTAHPLLDREAVHQRITASLARQLTGGGQSFGVLHVHDALPAVPGWAAAERAVTAPLLRKAA